MKTMQAVVSLLDRMMAHQNMQAAALAPSQQFAPGPFQRRNCRVCGDTNHSTLMHCKRKNLCLLCFTPGHWKREYNKQGQRQMGQADVGLSQPLGN